MGQAQCYDKRERDVQQLSSTDIQSDQKFKHSLDTALISSASASLTFACDHLLGQNVCLLEHGSRWTAESVKTFCKWLAINIVRYGDIVFLFAVFRVRILSNPRCTPSSLSRHSHKYRLWDGSVGTHLPHCAWQNP